MTSPVAAVPLWLQNAHNHEHINDVLQLLADRERSRSRARNSSRYRSEISLKHRLTQAVLHTKDDLSEHYSVACGCDPENQPSNRYTDIEPYDRTRVTPSGRYFNGNWVRERAGGHWFIATQAPLPNTVHEFLSIITGTDQTLRPPDNQHVVFRRIRTVVQLTRDFEDGRQKAHVYFPSTPGESWVVHPRQDSVGLPPLKVTLVKNEAIDSAHCVVSTVSVAQLLDGIPKQAVTFHHMLYYAWPDHGVPQPEDRAGLLDFIRLVYRTNTDTSDLPEPNPDHEPPIMVNCSAGVGRTGAFIALTSLLRSNHLLDYKLNAPPHPPTPRPEQMITSPLGPLPDSVAWDEVAQEIDSLREQRPSMVQRPEQTVLIYEVLLGAFLATDKVDKSGS
ncbi:phosphatases II [Artomyces pyxidatus]|uniref:Phosphatases II n=1 Tax=Artomyces pyxidatus TaxID=48021 RepID=A0ACB8THR0_9AGAM|nr:phosphatases II [Artomyces pyxidatus]